VKSGVCNLSPHDWVELLHLIGVAELVKEQTVDMAGHVVEACGKEYWDDVEKALGGEGLSVLGRIKRRLFKLRRLVDQDGEL